MDKAEGILVAPRWPCQLFYSKIMKIEKLFPIIMPASVTDLVHPNKEKMKATIPEKANLITRHTPFFYKHEGKFTPAWNMLSVLRISG